MLGHTPQKSMIRSAQDPERLPKPGRKPARKELFVTSLSGDTSAFTRCRWMALEEKLSKVPSTHPARLKFFRPDHYYGQGARSTRRSCLDPSTATRCGRYGRRSRCARAVRYLDVWNHERFRRQNSSASPTRTMTRARCLIRYLTRMTPPVHEPVMLADSAGRCFEPGRGGLFVTARWALAATAAGAA